MTLILCRILGSFLLFFTAAAIAQEPGRWSAQIQPDKSVVLTLRSADPHGYSGITVNVPRARLQGLNLGPGPAGTNVRFQMTAEAGRMVFGGSFSGGAGSGESTFSPDPRFGNKMEKLGFSVDPPQQLAFMLYNVTAEYATQMHQMTGTKAGGRLLKLAQLKVTPAYIQQLSKAAGERLEDEEVIESVRHGVTPEYITAVRKLIPKAEFDEIANLQRRKVSVEFIAAAQKCQANISADEIEHLKRKYGGPCAPMK